MVERIYPVGIQTFSDLINRGCVYVDKTALVYRMTKKYKYVFLSRPRRFGKSLLSSTLHSYFAGEKDLFKGLAIEVEKDWTEYPVLHFDMSTFKYCDIKYFKEKFDIQLEDYEKKYEIENNRDPRQQIDDADQDYQKQDRQRPRHHHRRIRCTSARCSPRQRETRAGENHHAGILHPYQRM